METIDPGGSAAPPTQLRWHQNGSSAGSVNREDKSVPSSGTANLSSNDPKRKRRQRKKRKLNGNGPGSETTLGNELGARRLSVASKATTAEEIRAKKAAKRAAKRATKQAEKKRELAKHQDVASARKKKKKKKSKSKGGGSIAGEQGTGSDMKSMDGTKSEGRVGNREEASSAGLAETGSSANGPDAGNAGSGSSEEIVVHREQALTISAMGMASVSTLEKEARIPPSRPRSPVRAPSLESGGVPEPTATYLQLAAEQLSLPAPAAQPLLVVIDLNGTLLHRPNRRDAPRHFVARPHAATFLNYCIRNFWVVLWSSARPDNVDAMCAQLVDPRARQRLVAVWGRDRFGLTAEDYDRRVQCYKRLSALWTHPKVSRSHPQYPAGGRWSQANTVLIDDSLEKARSEPFNLVEIPEFFGDASEEPAVLPMVHDYLNTLSFQTNVSAYMRLRRFRPAGNEA